MSPAPLVPGVFVARPNRFVATVMVEGALVAAHLPNSGRLRELLTPGAVVYLAAQGQRSNRKTAHTLVMVEHQGILVSLDSTLPNRFVRELIEAKRLPPLASCGVERAEYRHGHSRFDLLLQSPAGPVLAEIKSCTLVADGIARFPDAPTTRGARHLDELRLALDQGFLAMVIMVVQRQDAHAFTPNAATDPAFARAFWRALDAGVTPLLLVTRTMPDGSLRLLAHHGKEAFLRRGNE